MSLDMIPWYYKAGAALLLMAAVVGGAEAYKTHIESVADKAGYDRAQGEWVKREAGIAEAARKTAAADTKAAQDATKALQEKFDALADIRQKEKATHEQDKRNAIAGALARTERLRIPTDPNAGSAVRETGDGQGAALGRGLTTASSTDLMPEGAALLFDFAGDYGQIVRDYNTVIDRYADAVHACNDVPKTTTVITQPQEE